MATHSSILVWEIPWIKEPGRLQSTSQRVRRDLVTKQQQYSNGASCWDFVLKDVIQGMMTGPQHETHILALGKSHVMSFPSIRLAEMVISSNKS